MLRIVGLLLVLLQSCSALRAGPIAGRARPLVMGWPFGKGGGKKITVDEADAIAFKNPDSLTEEEERRLKLEVGTNWKPRTSTKKGEGYQFFQGPTPKTGVQEDLPDFFSGENFAAAGGLSGTQLAIIGLGGALFAVLFGFLLTS